MREKARNPEALLTILPNGGSYPDPRALAGDRLRAWSQTGSQAAWRACL